VAAVESLVVQMHILPIT